MKRTLDALDQLSLASECLMASLTRPDVRPVVSNLFKHDILDRWIGDHFERMIERLPEYAEAPAVVIVQLVMNLSGKMSLVKTAKEFEYLCDVGLDLCDVYRESSGDHSEAIYYLGHPMPVGTRDAFIALAVSRFLGRKMNTLLIHIAPAEHHKVIQALSESLIGQVLMDKLKDGSFYDDEVYNQQLKYSDDGLTLVHVDGEDTAPIVLPVQDEEWPDLINAHEN